MSVNIHESTLSRLSVVWYPSDIEPESDDETEVSTSIDTKLGDDVEVDWQDTSVFIEDEDENEDEKMEAETSTSVDGEVHVAAEIDGEGSSVSTNPSMLESEGTTVTMVETSGDDDSITTVVEEDAEADRLVREQEQAQEKAEAEANRAKVVDFGGGIRFRVDAFSRSDICNHYHTFINPNPDRTDEEKIILMRNLLNSLIDNPCYLDLRSFITTDGYHLVNATSLTVSGTVHPGRYRIKARDKPPRPPQIRKRYRPITLNGKHPTLHRVRQLGIQSYMQAAKRYIDNFRAYMDIRLDVEDLGWVESVGDARIALGCIAISSYATGCCEITRYADFRAEVLGGQSDEVVKVEGLIANWKGVRRHLGLGTTR